MAFLPRNERFFELFEQQATLLSKAMAEFAASAADSSDWSAISARLAALEKDADSVTHDTIAILSRTFITPLDSEDIHAIAVAQDDVIDTLAGAVSKWEAMGLAALPPDARSVADALESMAGYNVAVFHGIAENDIPSSALDKMHAAKDDIVRQIRTALRTLFTSGPGPLEIVRMKEVYDGLEAVAIRLNRVAHIVQGVMLKNA